MNKALAITSGLAVGLYLFTRWQINNIISNINVTPNGLRFVNANTLQFTLTVSNANRTPLPVKMVKGILLYEGNVIADFVKPFAQAIPAHGETTFTIQVNLNYEGMSNALLAFIQNVGNGLFTGVHFVGEVFTSLVQKPFTIDKQIQVLNG